MNIEKHLSSLLEIKSDWITVSWDCGHLLELAINDLKRHTKFRWLINFMKLCAALMQKYSHGKQYEVLLKTAEHLAEDILAPKQFHTTRFVSSERRVYYTILRDWKSLNEIQEGENTLQAFSQGDVSNRTRHAEATSRQGGGDELNLKVSRATKVLVE